MYESLHVAVKKYINYSFFTFIQTVTCPVDVQLVRYIIVPTVLCDWDIDL